MRFSRTMDTAICLVLLFTMLAGPQTIAHAQGNEPQPPAAPALDGPTPADQVQTSVYLPLLLSPTAIQPLGDAPRVNIPYFDGKVNYSEEAIFWFGRVNSTENYADVRVGYNAEQIQVILAIFDRYLWYDPTPSAADLTTWDAASLYLNLNGNAGSATSRNAYRFDGQLNWWEARDKFQAAYQGNGLTWEAASIPFSTVSGWRGNAPNDMQDDRGWTISFNIPFTSLGLSGPPARGTVWGLSLKLYDRDDAAGTPIPEKEWPERMDPTHPDSWGQLAFGLPAFSAPVGVAVSGTARIRHQLNSARVVDGTVGGSSVCGRGTDYWTEWGDKNYAGAVHMNVQNERDVSDWPCFSKYYLTFPLDALPTGKVILSASLTLHEMGNAGGGSWGPAPDSLIQVSTVAEDWDEASLTWNNAPLARENVSQTWVKPILEWPGWPGVPWTWDLSKAVSEAYAAGEPLRLVLYSADGGYNSGKYFLSSDEADWNATGRPTLDIQFGNP